MFGRQITRRHVITGAASLAVIGGALVPTLAFAQSGSGNVPALAHGVAMGAASVPADGDGSRFHLGGRGGAFGHGAALEKVAATLGVTVDALEDAIHEARQATRPTERPTTPPTEEEMAAKKAAFLAAVASELGVTQDALEAAIEAAQPTDEEIAAAKAEARANLETRLAEQVAAGKITQEQADEILARFDSGEGRGFKGGRGHGRGFGAFGGLGVPGTPTAPTGLSF